MSSFIYYINWLPLQGLTQSSSHKSIPVKLLGLLTQKTQRLLKTGQSPAHRVNPSAHLIWLPRDGVSPWQCGHCTHTMRECIPGCEVDTQAYTKFNTSYITSINNVSWYLSGVTGVVHVEAMQFFLVTSVQFSLSCTFFAFSQVSHSSLCWKHWWSSVGECTKSRT